MATYRKLLKNRNGDIIIPVTDLMDDYSTTEINTGRKWIDGRYIYKKTIDFGYLPNNSTKSVSMGLSSYRRIVKVEIDCDNGSGKGFVNIPSATLTNAGWNFYITNSSNAGTVNIATASDRTALYAYVTIYYTK